MIYSEIMRQAIINIMASKMRSFLSLLGVLIGTASVVALMSCGTLATETALMQFKNLGTELLSLSVYPKNTERKQTISNHISLELWKKLPEYMPEIVKVAPYFLNFHQMTFEGTNIQGTITGADEHLADILNIRMESGHFVSFVQSFEPYCVIGRDIAEQIKKITQDSPIGKQLRIGSILYTIAGITKPWEGNIFFMDNINQTVVVPIGGIALINKDTAINNAIFQLKPDSAIDEIIANLKNLVSIQAPQMGLNIRSSKQLIAGLENQGKIFTFLLAIIGSIALLVGGTGIMNIMLVSVSERKKEIGLRKALGAKNKDIQILFITESILLSVLGGLSGILLGLLITYIFAWSAQWPFHAYITPMLAGFIVSASAGIFFGYYPAKRASRMEPVLSLRSD